MEIEAPNTVVTQTSNNLASTTINDVNNIDNASTCSSSSSTSSCLNINGRVTRKKYPSSSSSTSSTSSSSSTTITKRNNSRKKNHLQKQVYNRRQHQLKQNKTMKIIQNL